MSLLKYAYWGKQSGCNQTPRWSRENFISSAGPQSFYFPFTSLIYISRNSARIKKQLNEMKGINHIETLKLTFKKTTVDAGKDEPKMIFKTAYSIAMQKQ